jgi:hypothetical protein
MNRLLLITTAAFATLVVSTAVVVNGRANPRTETAPSSARPVPAPTSPRKLDEYGNIRWSDEKARLDNLVIELENDPATTGYLFCYGGRVGRAGEARRRCDRAAGYLRRRLNTIGGRRVVAVDGGYREKLTVELWAILSDATPPMASPTVDPGEVKIIRRRPKARSRRR